MRLYAFRSTAKYYNNTYKQVGTLSQKSKLITETTTIYLLTNYFK